MASNFFLFLDWRLFLFFFGFFVVYLGVVHILLKFNPIREITKLGKIPALNLWEEAI